MAPKVSFGTGFVSLSPRGPRLHSQINPLPPLGYISRGLNFCSCLQVGHLFVLFTGAMKLFPFTVGRVLSMLKPVAVSPKWFWWPMKNGTIENRFETIGTTEDILRAEVASLSQDSHWGGKVPTQARAQSPHLENWRLSLTADINQFLVGTENILEEYKRQCFI